MRAKRLPLPVFLISGALGLLCLLLSLGYYIALSAVSTVSSISRSSVARLPAPVAREVHIFEFYDSTDENTSSLERELDKLASDYSSYDKREKIHLSDLKGSSLVKEFGITLTPAVVLTNENRDFRLIFTGDEIPSRLRSTLQNEGYSSSLESGFG